jgi:hypothetical protein
MYYDRGVETSLTDRAASDADFLQAKDLFEKLLNSDVPKEIREAALDGMARTLEATSSGDLSEAIKAYETLVAEFPNSMYRDYAEHRIKELKQPDAQEFYAWFRKQNPKPADRPKPEDGAAASGLTTPVLPDLDLNAPAGETKGATEEAATTEPPKETTSESTTPPLPELPSTSTDQEGASKDAAAGTVTAPSAELPATTEPARPAENEKPAEPPAETKSPEAPPANQ